MDRLGQVLRRREAEVRGYRLLEARLRASPVLAPSGCDDSGETDVVAASPVARDRAEGGKASMTAVRRDADAVDARPTDDGYAPALVRPRPQHGERVVLDHGAPRPAPFGRRRSELLLVGPEVHARHEERGHLGEGRVVLRETGLAQRVLEEFVEHVEASVHSQVLRSTARPATKHQRAPVGRDEREVGLRVAAVDREDDAVAHATTSLVARSRSSSSPASSSCAISGCASSALRATSGSRVSAARAARRSYAATCWTRPRSSGASGDWGRRAGPAAVILAGASTTSSSDRPVIVSPLRTSTTCTSPVSPARAETSPIAASL